MRILIYGINESPERTGITPASSKFIVKVKNYLDKELPNPLLTEWPV